VRACVRACVRARITWIRCVLVQREKRQGMPDIKEA